MIQLLVMAKAPVPGRVKTRLCPPCTPETAAALAAAALADTLRTVTGVPAVRRTLVLDGVHPVPPGWASVPQRGSGLGERLASAFADTALPGVPSLLIGMDTPQVTGPQLLAAARTLTRGPAVLGPAVDGGWWALGLLDPAYAQVLPDVPMSTAATGKRTLAALRGRGVRPTLLPRLRDVDTATDALAVAAVCPPDSHFAAAVARYLPAGPMPAVPAGSVPAGSVPAGSEPAGSEPAGSEPAGSVPAGSVPAGSVPAGPVSVAPASFVPAGQVPAGSMPVAPAGSVPAGSVPAGPVSVAAAGLVAAGSAPVAPAGLLSADSVIPGNAGKVPPVCVAALSAVRRPA